MNSRIYFTRGKQRFEICHEPQHPDFPYAGYVDGRLSVVAITAGIAVQMLLKKHMVRAFGEGV